MIHLLIYPLLALFCLSGMNFQDANEIPVRTPSEARRAPSFTPDWAPFYHGVASGDPLADRVIIWTRVTPENPGAPVEVRWQVAMTPGMENVVASGTFTTNASRDYTVKVDVTGLTPGTTYYYGFSALGKNSLVGRTRTTPVGTQTDHLRFAVVSCSNFQAGFFNAYQRLSERNDLDAIIHLGDYIYERADGEQGDSTLFDLRRVQPPGELIELADYRARYSTYRLDTSLIRAHQQHPFITIWDDHESAGNAYADGAENHNAATEGEWVLRKAAAKRAYFEWMPIRDTENQRIYRKIRYGDLMDLFLLDTRLEGREKQLTSVRDPRLTDANRTLLGTTQKVWFLDQLARSTARWKVVGQQVLFSEFNIGFAALQSDTLEYDDFESLFLDIWDGYPAERSQIIDFLRGRNVDNTVILTGDAHVSFAFDVADHPVDVNFQEVPFFGEAPIYAGNDHYDPRTGEGAVAVEFVAPSITAANFDETLTLETAQTLQALINREIRFSVLNFGNPNPHLKYVDLIRHGYFVLDVKPDSVQADWYFVPVNRLTTGESSGQSWYTKNGQNHLRQAVRAAASKSETDEPAPADPPLPTGAAEIAPRTGQLVLLGLYPNPVTDQALLHYSIKSPGHLRIDLRDGAGRLVRTLQDERSAQGVFTLPVSMTQLPSGLYFIRISRAGEVINVKLLHE